jgi:hypothetical protein
MNNKYYTYAYLREDRTPYYIGKGKGRRAFSRRRNGIKPPQDKDRIILLKQNLTEEDAFKHEIYMIAVFGRKDLGTGILRNKTNGGDGSSGWIATPEIRKKMSEYRKGRKRKPLSNETKQKLRDMNLGKKLSEETKLKISLKHKGKKRNPHSLETKRKQSLAKQGVFDGKNNPMYGRKHSKNTLNLLSLKAKNRSIKRHSKHYEFVSPNGEKIVEFTTIIDFCEKYDLRPDCMRRVVLGQRKSHKGWTIPQVSQDD